MTLRRQIAQYVTAHRLESVEDEARRCLIEQTHARTRDAVMSVLWLRVVSEIIRPNQLYDSYRFH